MVKAKISQWLVLMVAVLVLPAAAHSREAVAEMALTAKVLKLQDGTVVRLAAIQAPNPPRSAAENPEPLGQEAAEALEKLANGKMLRLEPVGEGTDRRGRVVAMAYEGDTWLQAEMLRQGMAWVYTFEDSRAFAADLLAAEREAETARRGVWGEPAYAVLRADNAAGHTGKFRLVQGTVQEVAERGGRYYLNFGADWKTDFTLLIDKADAKHFDDAWLRGLAGKTIRARGWLFNRNGPAIALSHPEQLEIRHETAPAAVPAVLP